MNWPKGYNELEIVMKIQDFKRLSVAIGSEANEGLRTQHFTETLEKFKPLARKTTLSGLGLGIASFVIVNGACKKINWKLLKALNSFKILSVTSAFVTAMPAWKYMTIKSYFELKDDIDKVLGDPTYKEWLHPTRADTVATKVPSEDPKPE